MSIGKILDKVNEISELNTNASPAPASAAPAAPSQEVEKGVKGNTISEALDKAIGRKASTRTVPPISFDSVKKRHLVLRASRFASQCLRQEVLCTLHNVERKDRISARLQSIFDIGHSLHDMLRNKYFGPAQILWAPVWICRNCSAGHNEHEPVAPLILRPEKCRNCGGQVFRYCEKQVYNKDYLISGHLDGFLGVEKPTSILEIKTSNDFYFKNKLLYNPAENHIMQMQIYMWLSGVRHGYLFYFNKDSAAYKIFDVPYNISTVDNIRRSIEEFAACMDRDGSKLPKRVMCSSRLDKMAKTCPVAAPCFGGGK